MVQGRLGAERPRDAVTRTHARTHAHHSHLPDVDLRFPARDALPSPSTTRATHLAPDPNSSARTGTRGARA